MPEINIIYYISGGVEEEEDVITRNTISSI